MTRTVIALCDLLMRCHWVKRVLFLTDRVALVRQAVNAFKRHLPDAAPVNLVTEKDAEGRVYVSIYPTIMGLIDETQDGRRRFGVGHFDLIVIDEAHRSVFHKYQSIFDYFDSLLVGLTARPKDEVDRNTYRLFDLENGVPTDHYGLQEAVEGRYLVPPKAESHGLGLFVRSLVGMDLEAAKEALAGFLSGKTLGANQIEFVDLIVNHLTEHGVMNAALLYESPFTDITPTGPDGLFTSAQVDELVLLLGEVHDRAVA
jgi:type I site-specific restriction endonuclease